MDLVISVPEFTYLLFIMGLYSFWFFVIIDPILGFFNTSMWVTGEA